MTAGFVDEVDIHVIGGRGGDGCCAFRREKFVPRGGPSGGDGGDGGSVSLRATRSLNTLARLRHLGTYRAERGRNGEGSDRHGKRGESVTVLVPEGTIVRDAETGELLADLKREGDEVVVAAGGRGGRGNSRFATSTNRAPRRADPGGEGDQRTLRLELRLLADVGLVGLPNAGKSTLISRVSAARPKVAAYPFTTLVPNLGVVEWGEHQSFVIADIPGLVEGAHLGHGLGDRFLRHVQRTAVLLHLIDVSDLADMPPDEALSVMERELESFDETLIERPRLVVGTKLDACTDPARPAALEQAAERRGLGHATVSAVAGVGLRDLIIRIGRLVEEQRVQSEADAPSADEEES